MISFYKYTKHVNLCRLLGECCSRFFSCRPLTYLPITVDNSRHSAMIGLGLYTESNQSNIISSVYSCKLERHRPNEKCILYKGSPCMVNHLRFSSSDSKFKNNSDVKRTIGSLSASLVDQSPNSIKPYLRLMRIDRPIGTWLLFWPCGWSIAMAAIPGSLPPLDTLALFATGALVMRGAGCTINDMWDKDIDGKMMGLMVLLVLYQYCVCRVDGDNSSSECVKVERTKDRPLVSGALSQWDALVFLSGQLGVGLLILLQLNWYSVLLGASSLGLVILYPLMKRVTYWPQLILGMTFNWGALLGWSAVHGTCDWLACLPLYAAGICWTIVYDTIYAHQDKEDDVRLGIKSTAIKFGDHTKVVLTVFGGVMVGSLVISGIQCAQTWPYYTSVAIVATHLANQLFTLNINNPSDCGQKFVSNKSVGLILFLGILLGNLLKEKPLAHAKNLDVSHLSGEPKEDK